MTEPSPQDTTWIKYLLIGCAGLVVLALVVVVIAIVAAIAIPNLRKAQRQARVAEAGGVLHRGSLGPGDATGTLPDSWYDEYPLAGDVGDRFVITMSSSDFDAYLQVIAPDGDIYHDDDSAGGTDARVAVTLDAAGLWRVWAKTLYEGRSGDYVLTIERAP